MIYKASFLLVPCFYNGETHDITARYGKINEWLIDKAICFWIFLGTIFTNCENFPIDIYTVKDK